MHDNNVYHVSNKIDSSDNMQRRLAKLEFNDNQMNGQRDDENEEEE